MWWLILHSIEIENILNQGRNWLKYDRHLLHNIEIVPSEPDGWQSRTLGDKDFRIVLASY